MVDEKNKNEEQKIENTQEESIFKTRVFKNISVDELIEETLTSIKTDDLKVSTLIDEFLLLIQGSGIDDDERVQNVSFYGPILAELFKSSADFKKQKTDVLNTIQKYIYTENRKKRDDKEDGEDNIIKQAFRDLSKRRKDEQIN